MKRINDFMIRKKRTEKQFIQEESGLTVSSSLNRIFKKVEEDGLSEDALVSLVDDIKTVCERFSISSKGAILLACLTESSCGSSDSCSEGELANYLGCTNIEFISFHNVLQQMIDLGILEGSSPCRGCRAYILTPEALKAIEKDGDFVPTKKNDLTSDELFARFSHAFYNHRKGSISAEKLLNELSGLVRNNLQLLFCRKVAQKNIIESCPDLEQRIFFYLCHRYVKNGNVSVPVKVLMNFAEFFDDDYQYKRDVGQEKTFLQRNGLVTLSTDDGLADETSLSLSEDVRRTFFEEIDIASDAVINHRDIIKSESIAPQELFYNEDEQEQIDTLANLLEQENFLRVQARLREENMPSGFSCIFHGVAGSGKTASMKALARRTGRDIFWVDLSAIKSKWVGESEQNMKALFSTYREMVRTSEKAPILAVNEADAIFTRRITDIEHSVDNMYNAMTDIVLNELENLDGILIATTNLVGNMSDGKDNAMERRFIYKVEFKTPSEQVRAKIWKSKLKTLTDDEAATLARRFTFSGGNIENVSRKATVEYVLSGQRPDLEKIISYCEKETFANGDRKTIGF